MPTSKTYSSILSSPVGLLGLQVNSTETAITQLEFLLQPAQLQTPNTAVERLAAEELAAYFGNPQHILRVPIEATGSVHQKAVWQALLDIPCGQVRTYGQIAKQIASAP
ncbi:MAG: MGMT family protein, partial [Neisseriaceae bacterium]|nr:MGMT family protein [Neisseriaceae bacterium]